MSTAGWTEVPGAPRWDYEHEDTWVYARVEMRTAYGITEYRYVGGSNRCLGFISTEYGEPAATKEEAAKQADRFMRRAALEAACKPKGGDA